MDTFNQIMANIAGIIWHDYVLFVLLGTGILFTIWSGFCQYRILTHGPAVLSGRYDEDEDKGAISHFQALSTVLSATVGLGNIAGVALAVALGGPGAIFWMWVIGLVGMAIKLTEVTLSMLYRNMDDPENPHGGPMWVISRGLKEWKPSLGWLGKTIGAIFCVTLLVSTVTGGNMFQAWNVGELTKTQLGIPTIVTGIFLAILVGLVIIGGVKRIGRVAGMLVPFMVVVYLLSGFVVLGFHFFEIPAMIKLIVTHAFTPHEASGAFVGGGVGMAIVVGMQRAFFSSEAGQGSGPIAYAAAKTREPVREGFVGGLAPFIDTIVVCTVTALVIIATGMWDRDAEAEFDPAPSFVQSESAEGETVWTLDRMPAPERTGANTGWTHRDNVFLVVEADHDEESANNVHRLPGRIVEENGSFYIEWGSLASETRPQHTDNGLYVSYPGATLTAMAFDTALPGFGMWMVFVAVWLFAISTMIAWSYYGEQGVVFLFGERSVMPYRVVFCALIIIATLGLIETETELNNFSTLGTGVMLWANIPIMLFFGAVAMRGYKGYVRRLKSGEIRPSKNPPRLRDVLLGKK